MVNQFIGIGFEVGTPIIKKTTKQVLGGFFCDSSNEYSFRSSKSGNFAKRETFLLHDAGGTILAQRHQ